MATHEPDKEMFDLVKGKIKELMDALTQWQQKETAIHSLAEHSAKASGAPADQMDAHVYAHKKMIKKAMSEQAKQAEAQGVPSAQNVPGGPTSTAPQFPQGSQGTPGGSMTAGPGPLIGPPSGPTPGGQGGPGMPQPYLPMAGQPGNTGANGWEGLMTPTPYPGQARVQSGRPSSPVGPVTGAQRPMPGMPTPAVPGNFTGPNTMRPSPLTVPQR